MDFTPEYLSRYEEQVKKNQKDLKEKEEVIENLKADAEKKLSEKDETIATQANVIKNSSEENAQLRDELNKYHQKEAAALRKKNRRRNILPAIVIGFSKIRSQSTSVVRLRHKFSVPYFDEIIIAKKLCSVTKLKKCD